MSQYLAFTPTLILGAEEVTFSSAPRVNCTMEATSPRFSY